MENEYLYFREALIIVNGVHQENISVENCYDDMREMPQNSLLVFLVLFLLEISNISLNYKINKFTIKKE